MKNIAILLSVPEIWVLLQAQLQFGFVDIKPMERKSQKKNDMDAKRAMVEP